MGSWPQVITSFTWGHGRSVDGLLDFVRLCACHRANSRA